MLGLVSADRVRVMTNVHFVTRVPSGLRERQLVRASPRYRGAPWYDWLAFRREGVDAGAPESFGQARALARLEGEDVAIVAALVRTGEDDGPLTSRGSSHLRWEWQPSGPSSGGDGSVRLLRMPVKDWRRVVQVVPDFAHLFLRRGVGANPAEVGGPSRDVREQRYWHNAFSTSGGVRIPEEVEGETWGRRHT